MRLMQAKLTIRLRGRAEGNDGEVDGRRLHAPPRPRLRIRCHEPECGHVWVIEERLRSGVSPAQKWEVVALSPTGPVRRFVFDDCHLERPVRDCAAAVANSKSVTVRSSVLRRLGLEMKRCSMVRALNAMGGSMTSSRSVRALHWLTGVAALSLIYLLAKPY